MVRHDRFTAKSVTLQLKPQSKNLYSLKTDANHCLWKRHPPISQKRITPKKIFSGIQRRRQSEVFGCLSSLCFKGLTRKNSVSQIHFLFIGQLIDRKGIIELIDAFETVLRSHPHIKLSIVGQWAHYGTRLPRRAELCDGLHFTGPLFGNPLFDLLYQAQRPGHALKKRSVGIGGQRGNAFSPMPSLLPILSGATVDLVEKRSDGFCHLPRGPSK